MKAHMVLVPPHHLLPLGNSLEVKNFVQYCTFIIWKLPIGNSCWNYLNMLFKRQNYISRLLKPNMLCLNYVISIYEKVYLARQFPAFLQTLKDINIEYFEYF